MQNEMADRLRRAGVVVTVFGLAVAYAAVPANAYAQEVGADVTGTSTDVHNDSHHPVPRAGITAENVLPPERLTDSPELAHIFDGVREIPQVIDGIYCWCGCHETIGHRSLLTCYESGTALHCKICQGEGELAYRLHQAGATLDEIRAAVDAEFGSSEAEPHGDPGSRRR